MPIYYGNTKVDITSKGVVMPLTTPPAPKIDQSGHYTEGDRFLIAYTPTGQYIGLGTEHSYGWDLPLVDDASQAATFLFRRYYPIDVTTEDYNLQCEINSTTIAVGSSGISSGALIASDGANFSSFYVRYNDYNNVLTSMYAYIKYFVQGEGWEKRNIYNITVGQSQTYLTISYSANQEAIALPFKLVKYTAIPNEINKAYYGNTLVYQKQAPAPTPEWHTIYEGSSTATTEATLNYISSKSGSAGSKNSFVTLTNTTNPIKLRLTIKYQNNYYTSDTSGKNNYTYYYAHQVINRDTNAHTVTIELDDINPATYDPTVSVNRLFRIYSYESTSGTKLTTSLILTSNWELKLAKGNIYSYSYSKMWVTKVEQYY